MANKGVIGFGAAGLQEILVIPDVSVALAANVTGGTNSTADVNCLSLNLGANQVKALDSFEFELSGNFSKNSTSANLLFWLKVGATKALTFTISGNKASTNSPWTVCGMLTFRSIGASATVTSSGIMLSGTSLQDIQVPTTDVNIDTTVAQTISVGGNFSVANSSFILTARTGRIRMCQ